MVEAFEAPGRQVAERRPLAVYLHDDSAVASNIFAKNVRAYSDAVFKKPSGSYVGHMVTYF